MKKNGCKLLVLSFLFISGSSLAQSDSAYFDLGRIQLRKDFTQHITIKGSDLEHMPFARISDALAPWLQGTQSTRQRLVFVVDGNLVNSPDAWSVQDIEEITLIQNALTQVNGSLNNQQLVLVKTKRKQPADKGITVTGNHYLANMDFLEADLKSETNFYHQYHVGAWQNRGRFSFGASANWLRDVFPMSKELTDVHKPRQLNRFRFNGWIDARLAEGHTLRVGLNVAPQTISYDISNKSVTYVTNDEAKAKSTTVNPTLHLSNRIDDRLKNELDFSYFTNRSPQETRSITNLLTPGSGQYSSHGETTFKYRNVLLRERISYTQTMGSQWQFQTAVSFTYRSIKQEGKYYLTTQSNGTPTGSVLGQSTVKGESYVLTPTISLSYRNAFSFTGGVSGKLKEDNTFYTDKIFPFFTTTIDLLRIMQPENPLSLKIFWSLAMPGDFVDTRFQQPDLGFDADPVFSIYPVPVFGTNVLYTLRPEDPTIRSLQAGAVFSLPQDKMQVSYNYDNRRYLWQYLVPLAPGAGWDFAVYYPDYIYTTHRLGIWGRVIDKGELRWTPGISFTGLKYKLKDKNDFPNWSATPDANNDKMLWTGGFTNRLQYRRFSFGLDMLYQFNERRNSGPFSAYQKTNTFRLNNIYAGYSLKIANSKPLEVYISSRNCLQSDKANFPDNRRYYGAGFRLDL